MANYGESLAYWYLRLNGFFPLSNFVLHRARNAVEHSADADFLAVRFPHVNEPVGGRVDDWDSATFQAWGIDLNGGIIALIVEVKTGMDLQEVATGATRAFTRARLEYGLNRLGMWPHGNTGPIANELVRANIHRDNQSGTVVGKLLISDRLPPAEQLPRCCTLSLEAVNTFITQRIVRYIDPKMSDRRFFPSELMQYIIWRQMAHHLQR